MPSDFWKITCQLRTIADLHIGDGRMVAAESRCSCAGQSALGFSTGNINHFVRDHRGKPYIPGTHLKGVLCSWLDTHCELDNSLSAARNRLFGQPVPLGSSASDVTGGKVTICDAFHTGNSPGQLRLPSYRPCCGTWLHANNSINPFTGTAADDHLYLVELVPAYSQFEFEVLVRNFKETTSEQSQLELQLLLAMLQAFNHDAEPATLGAGSSNGYGRVSLIVNRISSVSADDAFRSAMQQVEEASKNASSFALGKCNYAYCDKTLSEEKKTEHLQAAVKLLNPVHNKLRLEFELEFEEGFLVSDPEAAIGTRTDGELRVGEGTGFVVTNSQDSIDGHRAPDPSLQKECRVPLCDIHGRPLVPAESLRGVLRSRAAKILRTLVAPEHWPVVVGNEDEDGNGWNGSPNADSTPLSLIGQLFGASSWGSLLDVSPCVSVDTPDERSVFHMQPATINLRHMDFVAINRVSGGAATGLKFDVAAAQDRLRGTVALDLSRLPKTDDLQSAVTEWMLGLLALVLMDACDGDLCLGFGKAKDLGRFRMRLTGLHIPAGLDGWDDVVASKDGSLPSGEPLRLRLRACVERLLEQLRPFAIPDTPQPQLHSAQPSPPEPITPASLGAQQFLNTYHFVPLRNDAIDKKDDIPLSLWDELTRAPASTKVATWQHVTHSRWLDRTGSDKKTPVYHGRIRLTLRPRTPMIFGGPRISSTDANSYNYVFPFRLPQRGTSAGTVAIPATTLRGMVSSLCEAASNSALRVLTNDLLSRRSSARGESISAIGLIEGRTGSRMVRPLCLPSLEIKGVKASLGKWSAVFPLDGQGLLPLRVYLDGYRKRGDDLEPIPNSFLDRNPSANSYGRNRKQFWYMPLVRHSAKDGEIDCSNASHFKIKESSNRRDLLGQRVIPTQDIPSSLRDLLPQGWQSTDPIPDTEWNRFTDEQQQEFVKAGFCRGVLRIMGIRGSKRTDMPKSRTHEFFIPFPPAKPSISVPAEAECEDFKLLSKDRDVYVLQGSITSDNGHPLDEVNSLELATDDLVSFDISEDPNKPTVTRVSVAGIWRRQVDRLTKFIARFSPRLLPVGYEKWPEYASYFIDKDKHAVATLAEQMFGFVEACPPSERRQADEARLGKSLASRISFRHARPTAGTSVELLPPVTLKILDSPKLPAPALYMKPHKNGKAFLKTELGPNFKQNSEVPYLHGRKQYLHGTSTGRIDDEPWKTQHPTENQRQKARVQPINPEGASFEVVIEFSNLSSRELGLLCYALQPRSDYFHKIGMGKSLGLGSCKLDNCAIEYDDRIARYRLAFQSSWKPVSTSTGPSFNIIRDAYRQTIPPDIRRPIELIGCSLNENLPVHPPQIPNEDIEQELFRWFMDNEYETNREAGPHQALQPILGNAKHILPLSREVPLVAKPERQ